MNKSIPVFMLLALLVAAGAGAAGYFYLQYTKAQSELQTIKADPSNLQQAASEEAKKLIADVGKLIELPSGEDPTVATVTDVEKLKDQDFFKSAKNGDKVLIYTNSKKAILYDPKANKVVNVAPVNIGTPSAQQTPQARIALRNGTPTSGLTNKAETDIKKDFPSANIVNKENAKKTDYESSVIVVFNESAKAAAENLAKTLNIKIGDLPAGEEKPTDVDVMVILGKDKADSTESPKPSAS